MGNITETTWFEEQLENMEDTMQEDEKLVFEEQFGDVPTVNPEFDDFDWDIPINEQPWYTPSTEIDLDRDIPTGPTFESFVESMIGEPEYLGDR